MIKLMTKHPSDELCVLLTGDAHVSGLSIPFIEL